MKEKILKDASFLTEAEQINVLGGQQLSLEAGWKGNVSKKCVQTDCRKYCGSTESVL